MKILTKELKNDLDLNEVRFSVDSRAKRTLPIFFLNDSCEGVYKSDICLLCIIKCCAFCAFDLFAFYFV